MRKVTKKRQEVLNKIDKEKKFYDVYEALEFVKENSFVDFDESIEVAIRLNVDPRHADQMVRGSVVLPNGTGKTKKVLVLTEGEKEREAKEAGADYIGLDEYIEKIKKGWLDFDSVIATPDVMGKVKVLGKILGPRKLMPNPKTNTVTFDIQNAISDVKKGMIEFRVDKGANIHGIIGKRSFDLEKLKENLQAFVEAIIKAKPASSKGRYIRTFTLSSTMGPGIKADPVKIMNEFK